MKIHNSYILTAARLLLLTTMFLTAVGQNRLDIYYTPFVVEALMVTELFISFSARAHRRPNLVSVVPFAGFPIILFLAVLWIWHPWA